MIHVFETLQTQIMNERSFILSQHKNRVGVTASTSGNVFARLAASFTEKFDAITTFVWKWTFK
jgi:hypothetical protein